MTILSFIGVFAALGTVGLSESNIFLIILGVFCGSLLWWLILAISIAQIRHKISKEWMAKIKILSGIILILFGLFALLK